MPSDTQAQPGEKKVRPIVPFLRLGADGEAPYLVAKRCTHCDALYFGNRVACSKCYHTGPFAEVRLSSAGSLYVYSIVHQSAPGIPVPYVAAIVDLPEGISVRCTIVDVDPDPAQLRFGMPVEMVTRKVREDRDGNEVIAFFFRPAS